MRYKIYVKNTSGNVFVYSTSKYEIIDNTMIKFWDEKKEIFKIVDTRNCEIEEMRGYEDGKSN